MRNSYSEFWFLVSGCVGVKQQLPVGCADTLETRQHAEAGTCSYERTANCCSQSGWGNTSGGTCYYGTTRWPKVRKDAKLNIVF